MRAVIGGRAKPNRIEVGAGEGASEVDELSDQDRIPADSGRASLWASQPTPGFSGLMAGRGATPKPDRRGSRVVTRPKKPELALVGELEVLEAPAGLLAETREWWYGFWRSDVAKAVQADTDHAALERLAKLKDQRERTFRLILKLEEGPVAYGSKDQIVLHPLAKYLASCDTEIRQLEDRFGLNPRARLALGLQLTQARRELKDLWNGLDAEDKTPIEVVELGDDSGRRIATSAGPVRRPRQGRR